jgi:hypothetical protein
LNSIAAIVAFRATHRQPCLAVERALIGVDLAHALVEEVVLPWIRIAPAFVDQVHDAVLLLAARLEATAR